MQRSRVIEASLGAAAILGVACWLASPSPSVAQGLPSGSFLSASTMRGNLTVELSIDPAVGPLSTQWAGPITRVDEVTILDEWVILRKKDAKGTGSLIVPRDRIVTINIGE